MPFCDKNPRSCWGVPVRTGATYASAAAAILYSIAAGFRLAEWREQYWNSAAIHTLDLGFLFGLIFLHLLLLLGIVVLAEALVLIAILLLPFLTLCKFITGTAVAGDISHYPDQDVLGAFQGLAQVFWVCLSVVVFIVTVKFWRTRGSSLFGLKAPLTPSEKQEQAQARQQQAAAAVYKYK